MKRLVFVLVAVAMGVSVFAGGTARAAAGGLADVERWLREEGLKFGVVEDRNGSVTHYVIPFKPEKSRMDRIDVVVQLATDRQDFLVVWVEIAKLGRAGAEVCRKLLEVNGGLHIARFAVVEDKLCLLYDWPLSMLNREWFLAMVYDAAQLVDNNYDDLVELIFGTAPMRGPGGNSPNVCLPVKYSWASVVVPSPSDTE